MRRPFLTNGDTASPILTVKLEATLLTQPKAAPPLPSLDAEAVHTAQLLSQFAKLLNGPGPDSVEAAAFLEEHSEDREFTELARLSATLKRALSAGHCKTDAGTPQAHPANVS